MKRALLCIVTSALGGCYAGPPPHRERDASSGSGRTTTANLGGRFFSRGARGDEHPLLVRRFGTRVTTGVGTVRSHLTLELGTADDDQREAVVRLAVPPGAAVTSAVLWVDGRAVNGAFVERQRATEIYRGIVARRRDPALVTWDGPGWLAISIFPLTRKEPRLFELEWVEPAAIVGGQVMYRVPVLSERGRLMARAALEIDGRVAPPGAEITLGPAADQPVTSARAPGDPFHELLVRTPDVAGPIRLVLVAETSAGMTGPDRLRQRTQIEKVLGALPAEATATIMAADWDATVLAESAPRSGYVDALERLDAVVSAGALHLERALLAAAERARATSATAVLFVGQGRDGFPGDGLREPLAVLRASSLRLSVVGPGPSSPLADAAVRTGGEVVPAGSLEASLPALVTALQPRSAPPAGQPRGAGQWYPLTTITGQTVWLGRALAPSGQSQAVGDGGVRAMARSADLLALWDRARLAGQDGEVTAPTAVTPARALLVLESEADYARLGIAIPPARDEATPERTAGILGVLWESEGAEVAGEEGPSAGGLGLVGTAAGGDGVGEGVVGLGNLGTIGRGAGGQGGRRAGGPAATPGQAVVRGTVDKEIVRRIVRRHLNEVRYCYEQSLASNRTLAGRVTVQFSIAATGQVVASVLQSSSLRDARVETCIVQAVRRWEFPRIESGGMAVVAYPFALAPTGTMGVEPLPRAASELEADAALTILAGPGTLTGRVTRIAERLGLPGIGDPESLAWTIDRRMAGGQRIALVGRLLAAAGRTRDAVRILSERTFLEPSELAADLRRLGAERDAAEVLALARRTSRVH